MPRITPYAGLSRDRLSELIREAQLPPHTNAISYTFSNFMQTSGALATTSSVMAVAKVGARVDPPVRVFYDRLSITVLGDLPVGSVLPVLHHDVPFSIHDILPDINAALGIDLKKEEVINQTFSTEQQTYPLTINGSGCYAWTDSVYNFKMSRPTLESKVRVIQLPGFDPI